MDKKEYKRITAKVFKEYGFVKVKSKFYLDLDEVLICTRYSGISWCRNCLSFVFRIKSLHRDSEKAHSELDYFEDFDSGEYNLAFNRYARGNPRYEIKEEAYTAKAYEAKLKGLLERYFEPFKNNALEHIKKGYLCPGYIDPYDRFVLVWQAVEYLGFPYYERPDDETYEKMLNQWKKEAEAER